MTARVNRGLQFSFRVYPDRCRPGQTNCRRRYFLVKVFKTVRQARADARTHDCLREEPASFWNWSGLAHGHQKLLVGPRGGTSECPERGILWLGMNRLGAETVSHEMTHMACRVAQEDGYVVGSEKTSMPTEERFCYVQGRLVRQFWDEFYRHRAGRDLRRRWARRP